MSVTPGTTVPAPSRARKQPGLGTGHSNRPGATRGARAEARVAARSSGSRTRSSPHLRGRRHERDPAHPVGELLSVVGGPRP